MALKTKIRADEGKQTLTISRDFDIPVELLFKAHEDPELVEQWMGNKVRKLENKKHGGWHYEIKDPQGKLLFSAHGVFHDFVPNKQIIRTFEMDSAGFEPQLEFLDFESLGGNRSRLTVLIIFKSLEARENQLKLPFAQGLNMAHNRLEEIVSSLKKQ